MTTTQAVTLQHIEAQLRQEFFEREDAIRIMLIALVGKFNAVILGPPGSAKTELMFALADSFYDSSLQAGLTRFTRQLNEFVSDADLFGPPNVPAIMAGGYERITTKRLPDAQLVLLDEVFKATTLLNTLLEVMNERTYTNGTMTHPIAAHAFFGTSNEMTQGEGLQALWDRFQLRCVVDYIKDNANKLRLLTARANRGTTTKQKQRVVMDVQDLYALQAQVALVQVPQTILETMIRLGNDLEKNHGIIVSTRRWNQCVDILQANALLEGRNVVEEDDFSVLNHVLWDQPEQREDVKKTTAKLANPVIAKANEIKDAASKMWQQAQQDLAAHAQPGQEGDRGVIAMQALSKINTSRKELDKLLQQLQADGKPTTRLEQAVRTVTEIHANILEAV